MAIELTNPNFSEKYQVQFKQIGQPFVPPPSIWAMNSIIKKIVQTVGFKNTQYFIFSKLLNGDVDFADVNLKYYDFKDGTQTGNYTLVIIGGITETNTYPFFFGHYPVLTNILDLGILEIKTNGGIFFEKTIKAFFTSEIPRALANEFCFSHIKNVANFTFTIKNKGVAPVSDDIIYHLTAINGGKDYLSKFDSTELYDVTKWLSDTTSMFIDQRIICSFFLKNAQKVVVNRVVSAGTDRDMLIYGAEQYKLYIRRNFANNTSHVFSVTKYGQTFHDMIWSYDFTLADLNIFSYSALEVSSIDLIVTKAADSFVIENFIIQKNIVVKAQEVPLHTYFIFENSKGGFANIVAKGNRESAISSKKESITTASQYKHTNTNSTDFKLNGVFKQKTGEQEIVDLQNAIIKTAYSGMISKSELANWVELVTSSNVFLSSQNKLLPIEILTNSVKSDDTMEDSFFVKIDYRFRFDSPIIGNLTTI